MADPARPCQLLQIVLLLGSAFAMSCKGTDAAETGSGAVYSRLAATPTGWGCASAFVDSGWRDPGARPFRDDFRELAPIRIAGAQDGIHAIRTLDVGPTGELLIVDSRTNQIDRITRTGAVGHIGRPGSGNGEYERAFDARFFPDGEIAVADPLLHRVSVFDSSGAFRRAFTVGEQDVRVLLPLDDSTLVVGGLVGDTHHPTAMAREYHVDGSPVTAFLKPDPLLFEIGLIVDQPWLAGSGRDGIYGGLVLTPTIERFDRTGHLECAERLAPLGWRQLRPRPRATRTLEAARAWIQSATFRTGAAGILNDGRLLTAFEGQSADTTKHFVTAYDRRLAPLTTYGDAPGRLLYARDSTVIFVDERPITHEVVVRRFTPRRVQGARTR